MNTIPSLAQVWVAAYTAALSSLANSRYAGTTADKAVKHYQEAKASGMFEE